MIRLPPARINRSRLAKLLMRTTSDSDPEALAAAKAAARLLRAAGTTYEELLLSPTRRIAVLEKQLANAKVKLEAKWKK